MPRPCEASHELSYSKGDVYALGSCRLCWLYANRDDYRAKWDGVPRTKPLVGNAMKELLSWFGQQERKGCKCNDRVRAMNSWGPERCRVNADAICGWLEEEAFARNIPVHLFPYASRLAMRGLLETAIRMAEMRVNQ